MLVPMLALGLGAGALTTVAGVGGGTVLVLSLAVLLDPLTALVVTAPALLVGNLHRVWMDRAALRHDLLGRLLLGAIPGSLLGGLLAVGLPVGVLRGLMAGMAVLVVLRSLGWSPRVPPAALVPVGVLMGGLQATGGGSGPLVATVMQTLGLRGVAYVATTSALAAAMHAARLTAYGLGGAVTDTLILQGLLLAASITAGNLLGQPLRRRLSEDALDRLQRGTLLAMLALAIVAVGGSS